MQTVLIALSWLSQKDCSSWGLKAWEKETFNRVFLHTEIIIFRSWYGFNTGYIARQRVAGEWLTAVVSGCQFLLEIGVHVACTLIEKACLFVLKPVERVRVVQYVHGFLLWKVPVLRQHTDEFGAYVFFHYLYLSFSQCHDRVSLSVVLQSSTIAQADNGYIVNGVFEWLRVQNIIEWIEIIQSFKVFQIVESLLLSKIKLPGKLANEGYDVSNLI